MSRAWTSSLYTSLRLQIPFTCSLPAPQIYCTFPSESQSNWISAEELFYWNSQRLTTVECFSRTFDMILNMTLPKDLLSLLEGLRGSFPSLWLLTRILDSPYLLIFLINTKHNIKKVKSCTDPCPEFLE